MKTIEVLHEDVILDGEIAWQEKRHAQITIKAIIDELKELGNWGSDYRLERIQELEQQLTEEL